MSEFIDTAILKKRKREAYRIAAQWYEEEVDWAIFFREVLGVGGVVRRLFPNDEALAEFELSDEYVKIQQMLRRLRDSAGRRKSYQDTTKVVTVRLPASMYEALQAEAYRHQTSMNKLCITKLLQTVDQEADGSGE